jgi:hypothetical protein
MEEEEEQIILFQLHDVAVRQWAILTGGFLGIFLFCVRYSTLSICHSSDSIVSEDAGTEPRTAVATLALTLLPTLLDLIH